MIERNKKKKAILAYTVLKIQVHPVTYLNRYVKYSTLFMKQLVSKPLNILEAKKELPQELITPQKN